MNLKNCEFSADSFVASRRFYDDKNYPRGFSRSGDYTISEVQLLEQYGYVLKCLADGKVEPKTPDEEHFVKVSKGEELPTIKLEHVWIKYIKKTTTPKQFHTLFGSRKIEDDSPNTEPEELEDDEVL